MKKILGVIFFVCLLASCTDVPIKAPCPNFGAHCRKIPINEWNYHNA